MRDFKETLREDLRKVVEFHGHYCPGIMWGYLASKIAMKRLGADRAEDEELIAIVENDSCAADAVQVVTGCTFGKGNFFFRDYGKHVYTFALRPSRRAIRISRLHRDQAAGPEDETTEEKIVRMLATPAEELFKIQEGTIELPEPAEIRDSVVCPRCGEEVMVTRTREIDGEAVCLSCIVGGTGFHPSEEE